MRDEHKTREQLIHELTEMRHKVSAMEAIEAQLLGTAKALRESEERFRLLYENAPLGYQSLDENGYFLEVNQAWLDALGYSREEVIGKWFGNFLAPGYQEHFKTNFPKFKAAGEIHWVEFEMIRKDGTQISVAFDGQIGRDEQGRFRQTHCILHDISEIKRSQEALQESEKRYRAVVDNVEVGISVLNANMEIVEVNKAMKRYFPQVRPGCGQVCYEQYNDPPGSKPCSYCPCVLTLQDDQVHEAITQTPAGAEIRHYRLVSSPIKDSGGRVQYVIELVEDITERKIALESLDRANEQWERTFNAISDLVMVLDHQHRIIRANKAMTEALGMTEQEVIGKHCFELVHGEKEPPVFCPHARLLADGEEHAAEVVEPHLGGIYDVRVSPVVGQNGQVIGSVHITRDVTQRKQVEQALQDSEERLRLTLEATQIGIWDWDVKNDRWYATPIYYTMLGYAPETGLGDRREWLDRVHPDDRACVYEKIQNVLTRDFKEYQYDARLRHADGTYRWQHVQGFGIKRDEDGKVTRLLGIRMDLTERKRAEEALREAEQQYRLLADNTLDVIWQTDLDMRFTYVNPAISRMLGYTPDEFIGTRIKVHCDEENFMKIARIASAEISKGADSSGTTFETVLLSTHKNPVSIEVHGKVVFGMNGLPIGFQGVSRDITEQKSLQRQLLQAQKMEAVGTLAGGIAHDFNNILQVVLGFSEILLMGKREGDEEHEDLQKILSAARKGADLVKGLLAFSRRAEMNPKPLNLNLVIHQAESILARTISKTIEIELMLQERLSAISADPFQIEQILLNLAINARDSMPEGGTLTFETSNVNLGETFAKEHLEAKPGDYVLLTVSDTGEGMTKQTLEHIFEPFFSTKAAGEGTGLGLAMVYGIVKQHSGHIMCYSEPGIGTTFKLYFPVMEMKLETRVREEVVRFPGGTETVLLVDDEALVRELAKRILSRAGYTVLAATNGREALQVYKKERKRISLVLLDLIMPEMDGKQCLKEILKINPGARVLVASGYSANGPTKEALHGGAKGFVSKPYDMGQLLQTVRKVLDET